MRRIATLSLLIMALALGWMINSTAAAHISPASLGAQRAAPDDLITYTLYLPLIARPVPTLPYVLTSIPLPPGSQPHGIALDVDHHRAFVGNSSSNSLSVIDTVAMVVSTTISLTGAHSPNGVAYHAGTDRVFVANRDSNNLSVVDPTNGVWIGNRAVGDLPDGALVQGNAVYVANFGSNTVSVLDAPGLTITQTFSFPNSEPSMLAANEEYGYIYISGHGDNSIHFIYNGFPGVLQNNVAAPYGLAFDPITYRLYAANRGAAHSVTLVDVTPHVIGGTLDAGQEPYIVGVNPRTGHVFVVCGDVVKVYDRRDNALLTTLPVGVGATEGIAIDPARNLVYITSANTDTVTVIQDAPADEVAYAAYYLFPSGYSKSDVMLMDDTGQHVVQLTHAITAADLNSQIVWRPDGKRLAYVSTRNPSPDPNPDHTGDIFAIEPGGHGEINLTNDPAADDQNPAWSPDGSKIAWRKDWNIWVMNADGSNKLQLTSGLTARTPQWSPDGQWINFIAWPPTDSQHVDVYLIPANGGAPNDLTDNPSNDLNAQWSPDSREIVFETDRHNVVSGTQVTYNWELYKVDISTTLQTRLTDDPDQDHAAAWSPDGARIAFISDRDNPQYNFSLYVMNADASNEQHVTGPLNLLGPLAWAPDNRRVAAQSGLWQDAEIVVIDTITGAVRWITHNGQYDAQPVWRPDTWR